MQHSDWVEFVLTWFGQKNGGQQVFCSCDDYRTNESSHVATAYEEARRHAVIGAPSGVEEEGRWYESVGMRHR